MYYENGKYEICRKCKKKNSVLKSVLGTLVFAISFTVASLGFANINKRIVKNTSSINHTSQYVARMEKKISAVFDKIYAWSLTVDSRLGSFYAEYKEEARILKSTLDALNKETIAITNAQKKLVKDFSNGKISDKKITSMLAVLQVRMDTAENNLRVLMRNPKELIEKLVKPTVGIAIRDKNGDHLRGSGVLFRREEVVVGGKKFYRYYGFTAYHVWQAVFKYYEDIKKPDLPDMFLPNGTKLPSKKIDRTLNPKLLVQYFDGNSERAVLYIDSGHFLFPTKYLKTFKSIQDIAVFTFDSARGDIAVAELASDEEIRSNVFYGSKMYSVGIAIGGAPSLYVGTTASPRIANGVGISFQAFGYCGQSGGPIFDAKTMKIISINQRVFTHSLGFGSTPVTNTLFGTIFTDLRTIWKQAAPKKYKKVLDPK